MTELLGSAVYRPAADDVDVALLVTQEQFDRLIEQSFPNQVKSVRARGIDPLRMSTGDSGTIGSITIVCRRQPPASGSNRTREHR